jgi:hypothetical protein
MARARLSLNCNHDVTVKAQKHRTTANLSQHNKKPQILDPFGFAALFLVPPAELEPATQGLGIVYFLATGLHLRDFYH